MKSAEIAMERPQMPTKGVTKSMRCQCRKAFVLHCLIAIFLCCYAVPALAEVVILGTGSIPGNVHDLSGLKDILADGTPHARLGSIGSGIAYTGNGLRFLMISDRGPKDGTVPYFCRCHLLLIELVPQIPVVRSFLHDTALLKNPQNQNYVGLSSAIDAAHPEQSLRLDPEGVRVSRQRTIFIADEYGPNIYEFNDQGQRIRVLKVPDKFHVAHPAASFAEEMPPHNTSGRQTNRGLEGLAISPDGSKLYGIMQSVLIQDGTYDPQRKHVVGKNLRILEVDVKSNATREFLYQLDDSSHGAHEITAINEHRFLVLERDAKAGLEAKVKKIFQIDIKGATDISNVAALPARGLPAGVTPVSKNLFIDMLDPRFALAGADFPAKIEGLALGPSLPDGRYLLFVTSDNDFDERIPTYFYTFAIDPKDLPGFQPQVFSDARTFTRNDTSTNDGSDTTHDNEDRVVLPSRGATSLWWWGMVGTCGLVICLSVLLRLWLRRRQPLAAATGNEVGIPPEQPEAKN